MAKKKNSLKKLPHQKLTYSQKAADRLAHIAGSWGFITFLLLFIILWISLNITAFLGRWDPWPFILLNLLLSCLAALQAPIILMSQNRASEIDRRRADYDYKIDRKTHKEIQDVKKELRSIRRIIKK